MLIGVSVDLMLMLKKPRFTRAISESGQAHLIGPKTIAFHEKEYGMVLKTLGLDRLSPAERVKELKTMPLEKIMAVPPPEPMFQPCADGVLWDQVPYWDILADPKNMINKPDWVEAIMMGACKDDVPLLSRAKTHSREQSISCTLKHMKILVQILLNYATNIFPNPMPNVFYHFTVSQNQAKI